MSAVQEIPPVPDTVQVELEATGIVGKLENGLAIFVLGAMVLLSVANVASRLIRDVDIPGATIYIQNLNLLLTFAGAIIAARVGRHLTFSTGHKLSAGPFGWIARLMGSAVGGAVCVVLAYASWLMAMSERGATTELPGGLPVWIFQLVMPAGFGAMALRFFWRETTFIRGLMGAVVSMALVVAISYLPWDNREWLELPGLLFLLLSGLLGAPIFVLMAGAAMLLFFVADVTVAAVPAETYHIVVSPTLPVIPLFAFAGYLLARGGASTRLIRLFNAWFGWMPGGVAIVTTLVCAFFTTFTGASGVTILGMGGLLLPMLLRGGYSERYSLGLLTTAGSLGMLFPPSLPVILYGVMAGIAIDQLFLAGLVPGAFLILTVALYGIVTGIKGKVPRSTFSVQEGLSAIWGARYEMALPVILFTGLFGIPGVMSGFLNLAEAASVVVIYITFIESVLTREVSLTRDIPAVMLECATVLGALLIIFGAALGMTNYMVDAEIPMRLTAWVQVHIHERWLFVLVLNLVLLVVGSMMEGFSAIVILVPLITPIGAAFGLHPIHLAILFLTNLEVGFLLPPIGLNLFLASIRFRKPLASMYRPILPFLILMLVCVLVISYVPSLSLLFVPPEVVFP